MAVIREAVMRGYRVSLPMSEDCPYDLVVERRGALERVQCKYAESNGLVVPVRCKTSNANCEIRYTSAEIEWLAVYDATTAACYFLPATLLGEAGRTIVHLRLGPPANRQVARLHWATDYLDW